MKRPAIIGLGVAFLIAAIVVLSMIFTVYQTQNALVLRFGDLRREIVNDPGLHFKIPIVDEAVFVSSQVLPYDAEPREVILGDQKRLVVDAFARYRIISPGNFYRTVGADEATFLRRLDNIMESSLREVLGSVALFDVLSDRRPVLMTQIQEAVNQQTDRFGVDVVDVRLKRADLPEENNQAIYARMQTEREREARELRAQGQELGQRIRSRADRERRVIIAEAQKESEIIRGTGEADAVRIFADSFGQDVDFYTFYRSLQAYRQALGDNNTNIVLSPDSQFFQFFNNPQLDQVVARSQSGRRALAEQAAAQEEQDQAQAAQAQSGEADAANDSAPGAEELAGQQTTPIVPDGDVEEVPLQGDPERLTGGTAAGQGPVEGDAAETLDAIEPVPAADLAEGAGGDNETLPVPGTTDVSEQPQGPEEPAVTDFVEDDETIGGEVDTTLPVEVRDDQGPRPAPASATGTQADDAAAQ